MDRSKAHEVVFEAIGRHFILPNPLPDGPVNLTAPLLADLYDLMRKMGQTTPGEDKRIRRGRLFTPKEMHVAINTEGYNIVLIGPGGATTEGAFLLTVGTQQDPSFITWDVRITVDDVEHFIAFTDFLSWVLGSIGRNGERLNLGDAGDDSYPLKVDAIFAAEGVVVPMNNVPTSEALAKCREFYDRPQELPTVKGPENAIFVCRKRDVPFLEMKYHTLNEVLRQERLMFRNIIRLPTEKIYSLWSVTEERVAAVSR